MVQSNENSHLCNQTEVILKSFKDQSAIGQEHNVILEEDRSFAKATLSSCSNSKVERTKVLGISWNSSQDNFIFNLADLAESMKDISPMKRKVLRVIAKIYDPLGLIAPITAPMKVFLQDLFKEKLPWDETLPDDLSRRWASLLSDFMRTGHLNVPRYYHGLSMEKPEQIELFGFCDSSQ